MKKNAKPAPLKRLPMPVPGDLDMEKLKIALAALQEEPHDGWADLVVHSAQLRCAWRLARDVRDQPFKLRILVEERHGYLAWFVRTQTAEVAVL